MEEGSEGSDALAEAVELGLAAAKTSTPAFARLAAEHGAARAAFQVFLVRQAGLAEMHMRVHDAGQKVQPAAVDGLAGMAQRQIADGREAAAAYADIAQALAVLIDDGSTLENEVIGFGHGGPVGFKTGL